MDAKTFHLEIITPDKKVVDQRVDYVSVPGAEGEFGVLPGHSDLVSLVRSGELYFDTSSGKSYYAVSGGYAYVNESSVAVLVENAEKGEQIDLERAVQDRDKLEEVISGLAVDDKTHDKYMKKLERARARIAVAARFTEKK